MQLESFVWENVGTRGSLAKLEPWETQPYPIKMGSFESNDCGETEDNAY